MSYTVLVRGAAERDLARAQRWYEAQQAGLGFEFHTEFGRLMARLEETPLLYPVMYRSVRRAVLHRFPFLVWFVVQDSVVKVLACTHGRTDPRRLPGRLR